MAPKTQDSRALALAAVLAAAAPLAALAAAAPPAPTEAADVIMGGPGAETLQGMGGGDSIRGMEGDDRVMGNTGDDSVGGGPGNDEVRGGRGQDTVNGGQGDDTVAGDRDNDTVTGGLGADLFLFDLDAGSDSITDFDSAGGDRVRLPPGVQPVITDTPRGASLQLTGAGALLFVGVPMASLGTWQAPPVVVPEPGPPPHLTTVPNPPAAPNKLLLALIVALSIAFVVLLAIGLTQLVRGGRDRRL